MERERQPHELAHTLATVGERRRTLRDAIARIPESKQGTASAHLDADTVGAMACQSARHLGLLEVPEL